MCHWQNGFLAGVLVLPVLADGVGDFDEPGTVFGGFENVSSSEKFCAILGRVAERLEQPRRNQRGKLTTNYPRMSTSLNGRSRVQILL